MSSRSTPSSSKNVMAFMNTRYNAKMVDRSPQRAAWDRILANTFSPEWREEMTFLFPDPDFDELYGFGLLHKAVLGLVGPGLSIEGVIHADPSQIDNTDCAGKTALSWAVWRGDLESAQTLLAHRADCNKSDILGKPPIYYAASTSRECVELLIQANADVHIRDLEKRTLLHHVAQSTSQDVEMVNFVLQTDIDINAVTMYGETALITTDNLEIATCLMRKGVDQKHYTEAGKNALSRAIERNDHSMISLFLGERHDHTRNIRYYGTLMHLAAEFGNKETLRMLAQGALEPRDVNVKNEASLTPSQLAMQRRDVDGEWQDAFVQFLNSIDKDQPRRLGMSLATSLTQITGTNDVNSVCNDSEENESGEEFEEAVEFQMVPSAGSL